jgi:hypothetical protein
MYATAAADYGEGLFIAGKITGEDELATTTSSSGPGLLLCTGNRGTRRLHAFCWLQPSLRRCLVPTAPSLLGHRGGAVAVPGIDLSASQRPPEQKQRRRRSAELSARILGPCALQGLTGLRTLYVCSTLELCLEPPIDSWVHPAWCGVVLYRQVDPTFFIQQMSA